MKRATRIFTTVSFLLLAAWAGMAQAELLTWDADGAVPYGGAGTWDTTNSRWYNGTTSSYQPWNNANNDDALLDTTGGAVTLGTGITAHNVTFSASGYSIGSNTLTLAGTAPTVTTNNDATISSTVSGSAGLVKSGSGALALSGANNYTGGTTVNAGGLRAGSTTAFGTATGASLSFGPGSNGIVQLNGNSMTVVGLNTDSGTPGTASVQNAHASTAATLTINNAANNTFAGVFLKGAAANLALTKTGAGKLTLTGNSTIGGTIGGALTVNTGSLEISSGGYLYTGNNTASNIGSAATDNNVAVAITGTGSAASSVWRNVGEIRVGLSGSNNTMTVTNGGKLWAGGGNDHITIGYNTGSNNNTITVNGAGSSLVAEDYLMVGRQGTGATLNVENGATASCYLFWSSGGSGNPTGSSNSTVKIDGAGSTFTVTNSWDIADRGTGNVFRVINGGTANMSGATGYVGYYTGNVAVTVDGSGSVWTTGAVDWANGGSSAPATISNGGRWNANGGITWRNNNTLSLTSGGELNVQTLTLSAAGGRLAFNGGRLIAQSSGTLLGGSGQIDLVGPGYIKTDYAKSISNIIYDAGNLIKEGTGTLTLSGINTYGGGTSINAGTLTLSGSGTFGAVTGALTLGGGALNLAALSRSAGAVSITAPAASGDTISNGTLTGASYAASNTSGDAGVSAVLLGSGGFTKTNGGRVTLKGANLYSGPTRILGGTLALASTGSIGSSSYISISGGGIYDVSAVSGYILAQDLFATDGLANVAGALNAGSRLLDLHDQTNIGTLAFGSSLTLGGGTLDFDLGGILGSNDVVNVAGAVTASGTNTINVFALTGLTSLTPGDYTIMTAAGGLGTGNFVLGSPTIVVGGTTYQLSLANSTSTSEVLTVIPEPSTLALLATAGLALLWCVRRKRK